MHTKLHWREYLYICHYMCLGATVSHSMKRGWEHPLWCLCSKWGYPLSIPGTCTKIPGKKSMTSSRDHVMMSDVTWWCSGDVGDFGWWHLCQYWKGYNARDVRLSLTGPVIWASRTTQADVIVNTIQEGCCTIADAVVEKRTKARGARMSPWNNKNNEGHHHSIQHWRVDVGPGSRCSQIWGQKWWCD